MDTKPGKGWIILRVTLGVILFSLLLKIDSILPPINMNTFAERGWPLFAIILVSVLIRMTTAGIAVLVVLPLTLRCKDWRDLIPGYLRIDMKIVLLGLLSFGIFCALATLISLGMGIFSGDFSAVFAFPDIRPDPDVVGWGYFLLALVPGIWEELAFRGWIQLAIRKVTATPKTVLLSSLFFGLYHISNLVSQVPSQVVFGVIMATFFGIGWGFMCERAGSVVPAMISHYLVDSMGQVFLGVDSADPALVTGYFVLLTLMFPVFNILLTKMMFRGKDLLTL